MKKKYLEGTLLTVGASLWWGVIGVIYFKFVSFANPIELTIHRTLWTALILIITTFFLSKWNVFFRLFKNIIYISCNPDSYLRDLTMLSDYEIKKIEVFDQFPNTDHLEIVSILTKKNY